MSVHQPKRPSKSITAAPNEATPTPGHRTVLLASPRSLCAGVERAIEIVERVVEQYDLPIYVRKQIVHNRHVVGDFEARGVIFVDELDEVPNGGTVVFSAHGVSPAVRAQARERDLSVIDATCPLVTKVHAQARRAAARGDTIVLIGHEGHEEVEGTTGVAPDRTVLIDSVEDVAHLEIPNPDRVSYVTQTTLAQDETRATIEALTKRFPAARGTGTEDICYATTNRQHAVTAVSAQADVLLVVGSANSSNSVRLVELSRRNGTPAHLIDDVGDIEPEWLCDARVIGVSAGASAPAYLVGEVVDYLRGLGPTSVREHQVTTETMQFGLPKEVRSDVGGGW